MWFEGIAYAQTAAKGAAVLSALQGEPSPQPRLLDGLLRARWMQSQR